MYELINITTNTREGIFATCDAALKWIATYGTGNLEDYRIFPW